MSATSGEHRPLACNIRPLAECIAFNVGVIVDPDSRQAAANYRPAACAPRNSAEKC